MYRRSIALVLPPVPNCLKVSLVFTAGGNQNVESSIHFLYTPASLTQTQLNGFASAVSSSWATNMGAAQASGVVLNSVKVTDLNTTSGLQGLWTGSVSGTLAAPYLTAETCTLINFKIARRYRGGHPRIYLPLGSSSSVQDPLTWTSSFLTVVNSKWPLFVSGVQGYSGPPVIGNQVSVSYFSGGTWVEHLPSGKWTFQPALRPTPITDQVLGSSANPKPASQRRRMLR